MHSQISHKTVELHTLGCRLNLFETDGIFSVLRKNGFRTASPGEIPEVVVINTCTVTAKSDSKNRNLIRSAIKRYPYSQVWVTGCYAETDKDVLRNIPGIAGVVGNQEKSKLPHLILEKTGEIVNSESLEKYDRFAYADVLPNEHTRAYLKIQDGCDRKCSYCKIPQARGKGVSRGVSDVLDQVSFLQDSGVGEIILTGVNLGWFRDESHKKSFPQLLEKILNRLEYSRLRISSIEPPDVGVELADLMQHPRFCSFLHVPLQSGSSTVLRQMRRSYQPETFRKRIELVKTKVKDLFLGTDVIVGFPGETEQDFEDSMELLRELEFAKIHAFPFSQRKNTHAEGLSDSVEKSVKKDRVLKLMEVSSKLSAKFLNTQLGKVREAILERDGIAVTDNYLKVRLANTAELKAGQFLQVRIDSSEPGTDKALGSLATQDSEDQDFAESSVMSSSSFKS